MNGNEKLLKIALDELRVLMLGAQVLFGFQFQALFQEGFAPLSQLEKSVAAAGFVFIVATQALLIAAPSIHRLAERGEATTRMREYAGALAQWALVTLALALACDIFFITHKQFGSAVAVAAAVATLICCAALWYALGATARRGRGD